MRSLRCYYSDDVRNFLARTDGEILGILCSNVGGRLEVQQKNAWSSQIEILKRQLAGFPEGRIIFEYVIPRMGRRVDTVFLHGNIVFLLEFKCGACEYAARDLDQVCGYALDLKNFQKESENRLLAPILVATRAESERVEISGDCKVLNTVKCNAQNIGRTVEEITGNFGGEPNFDYIAWENSPYFPTPTIVEAARAMYEGHNVRDITRNDAGAANLSRTLGRIEEIIKFSEENKRKSICFVTGVPGAGKTLVGLNLAVNHSNALDGSRAVFLSGNLPLVRVLQEALARDSVSNEARLGTKIKKSDALRNTASFIQIVHKYRDEYVNNEKIPPERVVIFDEAQRAWTLPMMERFMKTKKGVPDFPHSEPEFLIGTMDRCPDWAVVVCLVGGGQEINTGEAGLAEWFDSLERSFPGWDAYAPKDLSDGEYHAPGKYKLRFQNEESLHLSTSIRSFRTPDLAAMVKAVLDADTATAKALYGKIRDKYPVFLTRNLKDAKDWVRAKCRGDTTRCGLLASSGALRLKPEGIFVKNEIDAANWFLNGKDDVRSGNRLEDAATEFDIQGLEVDYSIVAWDADFRFDGENWTHHAFKGTRWQKIGKDDDKRYLKNAYRVLLTRARQGMALFVPEGDDSDSTRIRAYYDGTFEYLKTVLS